MKLIIGLNVRHLVVIGAALVAIAVLAVAVTLLATGGGEQPERERTVTTTSSEVTPSAEEKRCQATVGRFVVRDRFEDLTITQPTTRITPSCVLVDGTAIALPTMVITGQVTFQLPEGSLSQ